MACQVWSFSPPEDDFGEAFRSSSPVSMPDATMTEYQDARERPSLDSEDVRMPDVFEAQASSSAPPSMPSMLRGKVRNL